MESAPSSRSRGRWSALLLVVAVAGAGYFGWREYGNNNRDQQSVASSGPAAPPIPVTVSAVRKGDFPVYLFGLGVVEPYDTVTVSSRVDGQVIKVDFKQGQMVKEGDVVAEIDPRPYQAELDQATAKKTSDEATLKNAQLNLQRYQTLSKEDFATRQQLDTQQATVDQLQAQIKGDQAAIDNAQTELSYTTIRSPLTGRTGFRLVDPGNIVHAAATAGIVTIVKLQPISVVFTPPEEDVSEINDALAAGTVPVDALSSDSKTLLSHGHLALVNNAVDQASGDIQMKATFENKDNALWPGLSVSTRLLVQTIKDATVVPSDAVQRGPNGLFVYVVDKSDKVHIQDVKVDQEGGGTSLIAAGLTPGQTIVTEGQSRLTDGAAVQANPAPGETPTTAAADTPAKAP
jgi:membrane fusion protein, multidrug efflux system